MVTVKKYQLIFDGDSIVAENFYQKSFRELLISQLNVNEILSYETLNKLDIDTLITIIEIELSCEVKIKEVIL